MKTKPCSECQSNDIREWYEHGYMMRCHDCGHSGPIRKTECGAVSAWDELPR